VKFVVSTLVAVASVCVPCPVRAAHPELFVTSADRSAIQDKIEHVDWARKAYGTLKAEVDHCVQHCQGDPRWMTSRLLMNWQTHYEVPLVRNERWIGGKGDAPVPTPRFAGARDWASNYHAPTLLEDFLPNNDDHGKIWLINNQTNKGEWVDPGITGRAIETANARILQVAADAAFIYWLGGDEKYARFASDVLWTYMQGFSYVQMPQDVSRRLPNQIIGMTSFEVIHEDSMLPLGEAYDFLHDYLLKQGRDVKLMQAQLKRLADRVIDGGSAKGNWNLNQAKEIAPATLVLDDNASFADGRGRQYYVNILLNARLPAQTGLVHVIAEGYDPATALWPEAPGYGFGTTPQLVQIASLLTGDPAGRKILQDPILPRALLAQSELLYPNGWSVGLGDTDNTRISAVGLELLIAAARRASDQTLEDRLTAILRGEIESGFYDRSAQANIPAITQYVAELKPVAATAQRQSRTYLGAPLNVLIQRNLTDREHSLAAAIYGTEGGHVHANGLSIELYGAGLILGADPGRGASYWQPDHRDYYSQPPAHNTVIINADSTYPAYGTGHEAMKVDSVEPAPGETGVSPDISFAQCSFQYARPAALQQRTLALIRTGPDSGFYFDVFRSLAKSGGGFHDYLYHDIGQSLILSDDSGRRLSPVSSHLLGSSAGDLMGYDYFEHEQSLAFAGNLHGVFAAEMPDGSRNFMSVWMPGHPQRRIFSLMAPPDHAGREALPKVFNTMPMPTLLVRQQGDAWQAPFVAVFEPYRGENTAAIRSVRALNDDRSPIAACSVLGDAFEAVLWQDPEPTAPRNIQGIGFQGSFGVVLRRNGQVTEIYLGHGKTLNVDDISIVLSGEGSAAIVHTNRGWRYSATAPIRVHLPARDSVVTNGVLPPGLDQQLSVSN
jgi:hypothetical protein